MAMIYLKGDASARLVQDRLPVADPGAPNVPWLELLVGSETSADYIRIWPVDPAKLRRLGETLIDLSEEEGTRKLELLKKRQNLREDHRGELTAAIEDEAIPMPPPEDAA